MANSRSQTDELLVMGRVGAPWGVKGWVHVRAFTAVIENLLDYAPWYLGRNGKWREVRVLEGKSHGKGLVARFADCDDRDAAAMLSGMDIAVHRSQLPEAGENEYYWNDLIGLRVVTLDGTPLGRVDHLLETGANDVLVVQGERERLVPFIQHEVIRSVDLDGGEIRVDWDPDF